MNARFAMIPLWFLAAHLSARALPAQGGFAFGGGLVAPAGEYSTHDKAGWNAMVAFMPLHSQASAFGLRLDGFYGQTPRKTGLGASSSKLFGLNVDLEIHPTGSHGVEPYLLAGLGYADLQEGTISGGSSTPVNGLVLGGGAGAAVRVGSTRVFGEARFIGGPGQNGVNFLMITLGLALR